MGPATDPERHTDGVWTENIERFSRWLTTIAATFLVVVTLLAVPMQELSAPRLIWCLACCSTALAASGWTLRRGFTRPAGALTLGMFVALLATLPQDNVAMAMLLPWFMVYVALCLGGWSGIAIALVMAVGYESLEFVRSGSADVTGAVIDGIGRIAMINAAIIIATLLRRAAIENDRLAQIALATGREEARSRAMQTEADWVDHYLHDSVVHGLKAIALGGRLTRTEVEASAREAAGDLDRLGASEPDTTSVHRLVRDVAADSGLTVRLDLVHVSVPGHVAAAVADAVREALRNVRLHSGVSVAGVRLTKKRGGLEVVVTDQGSGFDPQHLPAGHFGVRDGLVGRLVAVGGMAHVESSSSGTSVRLTWEPVESASWRSQVETDRGVIAVSAPFVAVTVIQCALMAGRTASPLLAIAGSALIAVVWVWSCVQFWRHRISYVEAEIMRVAAVIASVCGGFAFPAGSGDPKLYWLAGGPAAILVISTFTRPIKESVVTGILISVLPLGFAYGRGSDLVDISQLAPAIGGAAVAVAVTFTFTIVLRRFAQDADWREQAATDSARRSSESTVREQLLLARVADLRERILPFLAEVAGGGLDCRDPSVVRIASVYEARVRDGLGGDLTAWPLQLADVVDGLRHSGCSVSMSRYALLDDATVRDLRSALSAAASTCHTGSRIVVAATPRPTGPHVTATLTPYDSAVADRWDGVDAIVSTDRETYLQLVIDRPAAPLTSPHISGHAHALQIATMEA